MASFTLRNKSPSFRWRTDFVAWLFVLLIFSGCATAPTGQRIDNVPMYGQPEIVRPEFLLKADQDFIAQAVAGFGTREKASDMWWRQAEEFMSKNNLDYAMRRYNQSWLLNQNNFKPYWGFGRVMLEWGDMDKSLFHFEKAIALCNDDYQRPALLTDVGTAYVAKARRTTLIEGEALYQRADSLFEQAIRSDPKYGNVYKRWAMKWFYQEKYVEAWKMVFEARKLPDTIISPAFLKDLERKMPEPKNK